MQNTSQPNSAQPIMSIEDALGDQNARLFLRDGHRWAGQTSADYAPRADKVDTAVERGVMARMEQPRNYAQQLETTIDFYREAFASAPEKSEIQAEARQAFTYKLRERMAFNGQTAVAAAPEIAPVKQTLADVLTMPARTVRTADEQRLTA